MLKHDIFRIMAAGYAAPIVELCEGSKNSYKLNQRELEQILGRADIAGKKVSLPFHLDSQFMLSDRPHLHCWSLQEGKIVSA